MLTRRCQIYQKILDAEMSDIPETSRCGDVRYTRNLSMQRCQKYQKLLASEMSDIPETSRCGDVYSLSNRSLGRSGAGYKHGNVATALSMHSA
ncbi:hypothetical protein RRG08_026458 [Elysia crispata]|uniref:Uncharacterized protein n=1 Tax=Elysia crispata TaxID=231223 RepID=A0AAE1CS94_9GAST|nr:hypothetical protein RRG08_026458 [Elysia crispata]